MLRELRGRGRQRWKGLRLVVMTKVTWVEGWWNWLVSQSQMMLHPKVVQAESAELP